MKIIFEFQGLCNILRALQHSYHPNLLWWHIESLCSHVDLLVNVNAGNHEKHLKNDDRDDDYDDGYGEKKDGNEENDDKEEQECEDADHGDEDGRGHEDGEDGKDPRPTCSSREQEAESENHSSFVFLPIVDQLVKVLKENLDNLHHEEERHW